MQKVKILFLSANPASTLNIDEEVRQIKKKIREAEHRDSLEFITMPAVRPGDFIQSLNEHMPQVVHFSGHGTTKEEIILLDDQGNPKPLSKKALVALFHSLKENIRLVVLNACFSRPQAKAITHEIDCAIGMKHAIGDKAAITFAASFYRAIGFGRSIAGAFAQGVAALIVEGIPEETTPVFLTRHRRAGLRVFVDPSEAAPAPTPHGYRSHQEIGLLQFDLGNACLRQHVDLHLARALLEHGLRTLYQFSLKDPEWIGRPFLDDINALVRASMHFRYYGDLLRTQRDRRAIKVYQIAQGFLASAEPNQNVECERGKLLSSFGEYYLRLGKTDSERSLAEQYLRDSIILHRRQKNYFELFQSFRILADVSLVLGESKNATKHLNEAEHYWKSSGAWRDPAIRKLFGWWKRSKGDLLFATGSLAAATKEYRVALDIFKTDNDLIGMIVVLKKLESVYRKMRDSKNANIVRQAVVAINKSLPPTGGAA